MVCSNKIVRYFITFIRIEECKLENTVRFAFAIAFDV